MKTAVGAMCAVLLIMAMASPPTDLISAQPSEVRVEPGLAYGQIRLGTTPEEVITILGAPQRREEPSIWATQLFYPGSSYLFGAEQLTQPPPAKRLFMITVWDKTAVTRGRIRVGSTLFQVIDVFGDTGANMQFTSEQKPLLCLDIAINQREGPNRLRMSASYLQLGISFGFTLSGNAPLPSVEDMTVNRSGSCRGL